MCRYAKSIAINKNECDVGEAANFLGSDKIAKLA